MQVKLDAFVAEIARIIDASLIKHNPDFETLFRPHRLHMIMACLARCDIARGQKFGGRKVRRWRPSRRLRNKFGVKEHGIPDEIDRIEPPIGISTLADQFSELLQANAKMVEDAADYILRLFEIRFCT